MSDLRIQARVTIHEVLSERTYRAALGNGKMIFAYAKLRDRLPVLQTGDHASVLMSLCDFSEGRLVPEDLQGVRVNHPVIPAHPATPA